MNVPPNLSTVFKKGVNHSNSDKDVSGDIESQSGDIDILYEQRLVSAAHITTQKQTCPKAAASLVNALQAIC